MKLSLEGDHRRYDPYDNKAHELIYGYTCLSEACT
jgi:hypothetical protein